jgi:hypothetical protein
MQLFRFFIAAVLSFGILIGLQKMAASPSVHGLNAWAPYVLAFGLFAIAIFYRKHLLRWLFPALAFLPLMTSCNFVPSDKIGVRAENFGKSPDDFHLVYGKFPADWSASSWNLEYPGQSFAIPVDGFNVYCKDGVSLWCDPSVLCELIRTDAACQKYAFKFSAYKEEAQFQAAIQQVGLKECLDAVRNTIAAAVSDSIIFNRGHFETLVQNQLSKAFSDKYGINLSQFSMVLAPPKALQDAINDRLLEQEQTKKTMASLQNAEAKLKLAQIDRRRFDIESQGLTPQQLQKMQMEYNFNAWVRLANSPNKAFISGNPTSFMVNGQ